MVQRIFLKLVDGVGHTRSSLNTLNLQIERYMEDILVAAENSEPIVVAQMRLRDTAQEYLDTLTKLPEAQHDVNEEQQQAIRDSLLLEEQRKRKQRILLAICRLWEKHFPKWKRQVRGRHRFKPL